MVLKLMIFIETKTESHTKFRVLIPAYKGKKVYVPATRLFEETVELYRTDAERYSEILEEAKSMVTVRQNNKDVFLVWAASVLPARRCKWMEANIQKIEQFAISSKLISGSIFDITGYFNTRYIFI